MEIKLELYVDQIHQIVVESLTEDLGIIDYLGLQKENEEYIEAIKKVLEYYGR